VVLCRRPLLFSSDALGAAGVVGVLGAVLLGVALPLQHAFATRPALREDATRAQERCERVTARNRVLAENIRTLEGSLAELSLARHSETGEFLEFVSVACAEEGFRLQQLTPQGVVVQGDHRSWDAQVRSSGPFARFPRLLARIEAWSPFVHVRDLVVTGPPEGVSNSCEFNWTVRVNDLVAEPTPAEAPPR
jgi:hypothetical protein